MKSIFYILFLFASLQSIANKTELSSNAENLYKNKDYKGAIEQYEMLVKQGLSSYKLYYNLGNAYYKNNQLGKAIYNYELANKLNPNNEDIKNNLRIANEKTIDKIESKENLFLGAIKSGLVNYLSTTGWAWLSIISLIAALVLAFVFFITSSIRFKQITFFTSAFLLIVFITSMVLGFSALHHKQSVNYAIITSREAKVFIEPNTSANSKFTLHDGTKVSVIESGDEWTNIKLQNGNEGWVKTNTVGLF